VEGRAIRELKEKEKYRVMEIHFGDIPVPGQSPMTGYINAEHHTPKQMAELIMRRLHLIRSRNGD
jgi:hypothetical protein